MLRPGRTLWLLSVAAVVLTLGTLLGAAQQSDASRKALEAAAAKGSAAAQYALGAGAEADGQFGSAAAWYAQAAERGYAAAQFRLGQLLEDGQGVEIDKAKALEWYRKAAAQGFAPAVARVGGTESAIPTASGAPDAPTSVPARALPPSVPQPAPSQSRPTSLPSAPAQRASASPDGNTNGVMAAVLGLGVVLLMVLGAGLLALYLLPTIIAFTRRHRNRWVIGIVNLVFGFTLIVWLVCLIWALNRVDDPVKGGRKFDPAPGDPVF